MAVCEICEKSIMTGNKISIARSHVSGRSKRTWKPNIKKVRILENGAVRSIKICTSCLRSNKVTRAV